MVMTVTQGQAKALVIGMGASGLASVEYLLERGWCVRVADTRQAPPNRETFDRLGVEVSTGSLALSLLEGVSLVVMSPGISPRFGVAAPLVEAARRQAIEVVGEIELFARELARLKADKGYDPLVFGITGTNGKTTTTVLTSKMVQACGKTVITAGNIGPNAVHELLVAEKNNTLPEAWVLELSSFQLETTFSLHCHAAAFLNLTEDHLDWHGSMHAYGEAKARIFTAGTVRIANRADEATLRWSAPTPMNPGQQFTFGIDEPSQLGDIGLREEAGVVTVVKRSASGLVDVIREDEIRLLGRHNTTNAMAALLMIEATGLLVLPAIEVLKTYGGEKHRVEEVLRTDDDVIVVDDSKGTNVGAVLAAVEGFRLQKRRVMIVLGGDGKGQDFHPLAPVLAEAAGRVALIGRDAPKIYEALSTTTLDMERFGTLEEAVTWLWQGRQPGDVILLSPACASWDMFKDYAERSAKFIAWAQHLANEEKQSVL